MTALLGGISSPAAASSILTFNITGIANSQAINQAYGDRISGPSDAVGTYGTTNGVYTPNVVLSYGATGEQPNLWTTGYGDLTNIYFNDADGDTTLTLSLLADAGFLVNLSSFDLGSFVTGGQTILGARVLNSATSAVLWSVGSTFVPKTTHVNLAPNVSANGLLLEINLTGLGSVSDDIGIDNVTFSQSALESSPVPEPTTVVLLSAGLIGLASKLRRRRI
jgi:hypothetical protein